MRISILVLAKNYHTIIIITTSAGYLAIWLSGYLANLAISLQWIIMNSHQQAKYDFSIFIPIYIIVITSTSY